MRDGIRAAIRAAGVIAICLATATPAYAGWDLPPAGRRMRGTTRVTQVTNQTWGPITCATATATSTIKDGSLLQLQSREGIHLEVTYTNFANCMENGVRATTPRPFTMQWVQPTAKIQLQQLKAMDAEIEVGSEKCGFEIPVEGNEALEKTTAEGKSEETEMILADKGVLEKGEETTACKTISLNGTKKEGQIEGDIQLKGVKLVTAGGGFQAASYPVKAAAFGTTSQIFQVSKGAEITCPKVSFSGEEPMIQESRELKLGAQYRECQTKAGSFTGKAIVSMPECEYDYELEKGMKKGVVSLICEEGGSVDIKTGLMACEIKIGDEQNQALGEVEFANIEGKLKEIKIIPNVSTIDVEATECGLFGIEKGEVGKYSGDSTVEAAGVKEGGNVGIEVN